MLKQSRLLSRTGIKSVAVDQNRTGSKAQQVVKAEQIVKAEQMAKVEQMARVGQNAKVNR